jgi:sec-independent protein translocase protein TatB
MFDIGLPEFLVIAMIALIIFGPERLPEMAAQGAKLIKSLRTKASAATAELTGSMDTSSVSELANDIRGLSPRGFAAKSFSQTPARTGPVSKVVNPVYDPDAT